MACRALSHAFEGAAISRFGGALQGEAMKARPRRLFAALVFQRRTGAFSPNLAKAFLSKSVHDWEISAFARVRFAFSVAGFRSKRGRREARGQRPARGETAGRRPKGQKASQ
jgi:hypothetical protein